MMSTFVDVVGYQLEKVHTGAMRWLLDWDSSEISVRDKKKIIRRASCRTSSEPPWRPGCWCRKLGKPVRPPLSAGGSPWWPLFGGSFGRIRPDSTGLQADPRLAGSTAARSPRGRGRFSRPA